MPEQPFEIERFGRRDDEWPRLQFDDAWDVARLLLATEDFAIQHRLKSVRVFDGSTIYTVEEPSIWDDRPNLILSVEEFSL